jgi:hypothetical protein
VPITNRYTPFGVMVVEPDYLPDSEVFYFQPCLYPMKYLHPEVCTLFHAGECRGGVPPLRGPGGLSPGWGVWGQAGPQRGFGGEALEGKIAL